MGTQSSGSSPSSAAWDGGSPGGSLGPSALEMTRGEEGRPPIPLCRSELGAADIPSCVNRSEAPKALLHVSFRAGPCRHPSCVISSEAQPREKSL